MQLRPHQEKAIQMLRESFSSGAKRPLVCAPCAFGKTHLAAYLCKGAQDKGGRVLFICDRIRLVDQTQDVFQSWGCYFGIIQSDHHLTDYSAPIQICSIQTLARRIADGYDPNPTLIIVDECHVAYNSVQEIFAKYPKAKVIGLSATPYSKGLGLIYDDLLIPATTQSLLDDGFLTPITYYGGAKADLKGIKRRSLSTGGSDYDPIALGKAVEEQSEKLTGDIIKNWLAHGENRQSIAFTPSIKHSQHLCEMFRAAGISAAHIDGYMDHQERQKLFDAHDSGEIKILSCSMLLSVGFDSISTSCLLDCYPTASKILFQQRAGRIMRLAPGKETAIYLDHAGNVTDRHGLVEWMIPEKLSTNEKKFKEEKQIRKQEKETKLCPDCGRIIISLKCACGFEFTPKKPALDSTQEILVRIKGKKATPSDRIYMGKFYSSLLKLSREWGFRDGWAAHKYKERFGVWPRSIDINTSQPVLPEAKSWADASLIRYSKQRVTTK